MITIIDYGLGNISAFVNLYKRLNIKTIVARTADDLKGATKIILPGVGAFDYAMSQLNLSGMRDELDRQVLINKVPILGICVGMQIIAKSSDEGKLSGLCWLDAEVRLLDACLIPYKTRLPQMGWNRISPLKDNKLLAKFNGNSRFYFLHSYYFACNNHDDVIATTKYGITYASAINHENIFGTQFHPEKSHSNGVQLLLNFASL